MPKIVMTKSHRHGNTIYSKGQQLVVTRNLRNEFLKKGVATEGNFVSSTEKVAEEKQKQEYAEKIESYPDSAKEIRSELSRELNKEVIETFCKDERKTVREAAFERLAQLNS